MLTSALKFVIWLTLVLLVVLLGIMMHKYPKNRFVYSISYIISGATLIIYPGILAAGVMGLASLAMTTFSLGTLVMLLFLAITLLQPVTYIVCLIICIKRRSTGKSATALSLLPFVAPGIAASVILLL